MTYSSLDAIRRRGYRTRVWARLDSVSRGVFRCALWIAKTRGKISNTNLVVHVVRVALKLLETIQSRILKARRARAMMMFQRYSEPNGVFSWAPQVRNWLHDLRCIWYLGAMQVNA